MLPGQMSPWQLESVLDVPWSLHLNFHQNWASNSWDITVITTFAVGWLGGWLENWRVIPISAFNYVIVEVVAEIGNNGENVIYAKISCQCRVPLKSGFLLIYSIFFIEYSSSVLPGSDCLCSLGLLFPHTSYAYATYAWYHVLFWGERGMTHYSEKV